MSTEGVTVIRESTVTTCQKTRTGLPPAGNDEHTNAKIHHGPTSRCHLLFCCTESQG
jgi:hypothetical protein